MDQRIEVILDDITRVPVDAIVNAANNELSHGGGVCGAIHNAAGPDLEKACLQFDGCATGSAKVTEAYNLPASYVIHTVGPVWQGGNKNEPRLLANAYYSALHKARQINANTVAFPAISCGIFGYPIAQAAEVAMKTVHDFVQQHDLPSKVYFVCFSNRDQLYFEQALADLSS
jgi:O-acetyl-ADP-ribose deacetylase (regulator of RNase III)